MIKQRNASAPQKLRLETELLKMGIRNEADLREAITRLPALQIGIMVDPIKQQRKEARACG